MKTFLIAAGIVLSGLILGACSAEVDGGKTKSAQAKGGVEKDQGEMSKLKAVELLEKNESSWGNYSKTSAVPLYVEKPLKWFEVTNDKMVFTRKKLLEAQAKISMIYGKYERLVKGSDDKSKGYLDLLEKAEKAREKGKTKGWPVAFDQWVINSEEELDAKIAEVNAASEKNRRWSVEDETMYNGAKKGLKTIRATLVRFDDAYAEFQRTWDKVKLGEVGGISVELEEEVNKAIDITQIFINEWNRVK